MKSPPWLLAAAGELETGRRVTLDSTEARHAVGALRLRSGDLVVLADGVGHVAPGTITLPGRGAAEVTVGDVDAIPAPASGLSLAVAVLAGSAMDMVVQKAVELGVDRLLPVCCERSQMSLQRAMTRTEHWKKVSRQALKQCHRAWAMDLAAPMGFADLATGSAAAHGTVAHPAGDAIGDVPPYRLALLLIGPEGGFSTDEERTLDTEGWPRVCLGPHVLRAETAAIAGAAIFMSFGNSVNSTNG